MTTLSTDRDDFRRIRQPAQYEHKAHVFPHYSAATDTPLKPLPSGLYPSAVSRALTYMHQNYPHPIQLLDIAGKAGLSRFHFIRTFKSEMGTTPHRYLVRLRLWHAKQLLARRPDLKVKSVGGLVGYNDPTAFTRVFRQSVGVTPQQYRHGQHREAQAANAPA